MTDDTAWIGPVLNRNGDKYHTDRECHAFPSRAQEKPIHYLEQHGFDECQFCAGTFTPPNKQPEEDTIDWETDIDPPELED